MAIEVIDKIKQKGNNNFPLMDAIDVVLSDGTRVENKFKELDIDVIDKLPEDGIAKSSVMYFLGELASLNIGFSDNAKTGDMVFVSFRSPSSPTSVAFTTNNHVGLDKLMTKSNGYYELIGLWNGDIWSFVVNEVK